MIQRVCRAFMIFMLLIHQAYGQVDSLNITNPYVFSIEEDILNLKVQSAELREVYAASRSNEGLLETITSTYIITNEEIKQSGAINLGEALRLVPGLLVKQKTNGYFEVYIRGASGIANHQEVSNLENTSVLLTINGIPLNNWFQGGILWEAVPVALNDIRQIEVVTAPNTVFFGPNAATGVINIVTKDVEEKNLQAKVSLQGSIREDYVHRGSASFGVSDQLKFRVSAYYNRLTRFQDDYFLLNEQRYIQSDSLLYYQSTARETNTSAEKSLKNNGINAFVMYEPNSILSVEAMVGTRESHLQSVLRPLDRIALTNRHLKTNTFALRTRFRKLHTTVSYQTGNHELAEGYEGFTMRVGNLYASTDYDYTGHFYQAKIGGDVNYNIFKNTLSQEPENFVSTNSYADRVLLGTNSLYTTGLFVSQNVHLLNRKWRWQATVRADRLNLTNKLYGSYQIGSTYKIGKIHLLRANTSYGLGNFSAQNYLFYDQTASSYDSNLGLNPLKTTTYEGGYRVMPYNDLFIELAYFHNQSSDFISTRDMVADRKLNSDLTTLQQGVTLNLQGVVNKLRLTAFLTVQNSKIISEVENQIDPYIPSYYGGLSGNYRTFLNKLRFNASLYYYGSSEVAGPVYNYQLPGKLITNCKISYNVWDEHVLFFNGRNVLNNKKVESPFADQTKSLYMIGIDLAF